MAVKDPELVAHQQWPGSFSRYGWGPTDLVPWSADNPAHVAHEVPLSEYHEVLRPTHVVAEFSPQLTTDRGPVTKDHRLRLIQQWPLGQDLDN